ncbi:MAG TPA: phosphoribosylamine--glycine ligase, partial [Chitinophagaceae bacterium]|nr:phosphoribosylamine--glycine ligase [Chitinophagaceae bacterium]
MNILLLGSGGREHAIAWKIRQSKHCDALFIAPGNAGTAALGTNVELSLIDFDGIKNFCDEHSVGMIIVGPEEPLVKGIADHFNKTSIHVIGPSQEGAQLEGSKAFAKHFMQRHGIPTANYQEFDESNYADGVAYIQQHATPIVLKADGLAAGKGVVICQHAGEAIAEFELMIQQSKFGDASKRVVVEDFLDGIELSVFVLTDGKNYVLLPEAKDYKRIGEKDTGLNTGGMGAISPVPFADEGFMKKVEERIIKPTIEGIRKEKIPYKGFVFFGLIKVNNEPFVIEYNCRMGDPETEVVIPRIKNDLMDLFIATSEERLNDVKMETDPRYACTIMAVSGGYPGSYEKGFEIAGLDWSIKNSHIFHAGTKVEDGKIVTNGGRVLCVTSLSEDLDEAVNQSKDLIGHIDFDSMYY